MNPHTIDPPQPIGVYQIGQLVNLRDGRMAIVLDFDPVNYAYTVSLASGPRDQIGTVIQHVPDDEIISARGATPYTFGPPPQVGDQVYVDIYRPEKPKLNPKRKPKPKPIAPIEAAIIAARKAA